MTRSRSATLVRFVSLAVAAASAVGLAVIAMPVSESAGAASKTDSTIEVDWLDESAAGIQQPVRDPQNPHYQDFDTLKVTVSQTTKLRDQVVEVNVAGMAPTREAKDGGSIEVRSAMNFVQAMQCWGDPSATNFRETCQWGGWAAKAPAGLERLSPRESFYRAPIIPAGTDVPFLSASGQSVPGIAVRNAEGRDEWPITTLFDSSTSNEVVTARIGETGGTFNFETQTAIQAPHLGCGSTEERRTCYLVIVPRGSHFGGEVGEGLCALDAKSDQTLEPYTRWQADAIQEGSPLNPKCDYWDNRIVVPLTFEPVGNQCPLGASERRLVGSQLVISAMSSWQPDLCTSIGTVYSFSTNADATGRGQLLAGRAGLTFTSQPLGSDALTTQDRAALASTDVEYAPVTISGPVIAFYQEDVFGRRTTMKLTPRLVAKLLTQSYPFQIPKGQGETVDHLPAVNTTYNFWWQDPEFKDLNPDVVSADLPALILPGPASADAIAQVWRWVQADREAAAWLSGTPDTWGMSVNPYYLPKNHENAKVPIVDEANGEPVKDANGVVQYRPVGLSTTDGTALELATTTLSIFPRADETRGPKRKPEGVKYRYDSLQATPYAENLTVAARDAARADPHAKTRWDPTRFNPNGELGDWVQEGPQLPGNKFVLAITDSASAVRFGLSIADLQLPNRPGVFTGPTQEAMSDALAALTSVSDGATKAVDVTSLSDTAYPLTMVTYAAVNMSASDATARKDFAQMIKRVTTNGQQPGTNRGQLPAGYLPLPQTLVDEASASAEVILSYVPKAKPSSPGGSTAAGSGTPPRSAGSPEAGSSASPASADLSTGGIVSPGSSTVAANELTPISDSPVPAQIALGLALVVGLGGAVIAPLLMRPRRAMG